MFFLPEQALVDFWGLFGFSVSMDKGVWLVCGGFQNQSCIRNLEVNDHMKHKDRRCELT